MNSNMSQLINAENSVQTYRICKPAQKTINISGFFAGIKNVINFVQYLKYWKKQK
jgi:hypothetical protein